MPINRNAYRRYLIIDRCLRNTGRRYYIDDLLEEVNAGLALDNPDGSGIQVRQLQYDLKEMESEALFGAPIVRIRDGQRKYFRYSDPNFSITNLPVGEVELEQISSALDILKRFQGLPQFDWVADMVVRLEARLKLGVTEERTHIVFLDDNPDYQGLYLLPDIFSAIYNQQVLEVIYRDFNSPEPYPLTIHPQIIKEYNNRWYLIGVNQDAAFDYYRLALDRIVELKPGKGAYVQVEEDWTGYFDDHIGITRQPGEPVEVMLKVDPESAPYVRTKPIHLTQKHKTLSDGSLELRIEVIPNFELEQLILSLGERMEVLSPESLRTRISERLKKAADRYQS